MHRLYRAIVIRAQILRRDDYQWDYVSEDGMCRAVHLHSGWQALLWGNLPPALRAHSSNGEVFLNGCRRQQIPHHLDVWVDGLGKVLSIEWLGAKFRLIQLTRGQWETRHFYLPLPKSKRSPYYSDFSG
jgi:hypothetical protein